MATSTIRFRSVMAGARTTQKRARASRHLREHIARFSNVRPESIRIDHVLNDYIMSRSVKGGDSVKIETTKLGDMLMVKLAPGQVSEQAYVAPEKQKPGTAKAAAQPQKKDAKQDNKRQAAEAKKEAKPKQANDAKKTAGKSASEPAAQTGASK